MTPSDPSPPPTWRDFSQVHAGRGLTLAAIGTVAGLVIAGFGLFTAKGTSTLIVPADAVALVNQQPVSRLDFVAQLKSVYGVELAEASVVQKQRVLNDMIREEVMVQRGKELDVATFDSEVRAALVNAVEQQAAAAALTERPSETSLRAYYESHRAAYASEGALTARDLLFKDLADAAAASLALKAGRDVDLVLKTHHGRDTGKTAGQEFYFAAKIHLGDRLFDIARVLADGDASGPVEDDGFHVVAVVQNVPPVPLSFERAQARVMQDYQREKVKRLQQGNDAFLRKRANVLIAEDLR